MADLNIEPIKKFVNLLSENWGYSIPSDNLWIIIIQTHNRADGDKSSFENLYSNIISVNNSYRNSHSNLKWDIKLNGMSPTKYFAGLNSQELGLFLATDVTYSTNANNIQDTTDSNFSSHGGFISQGKIMMSRNSQLESKITFAATNWDINEILIDPWISAIGQQGLIESSTLPNIKADIRILQYAKGHPSTDSLNLKMETLAGAISVPAGVERTSNMTLMKEICLFEAFPKSRDNPKLTYDSAEAGVLKTYTTTFAFRDYEIKYHANFE